MKTVFPFLLSRYAAFISARVHWTPPLYENKRPTVYMLSHLYIRNGPDKSTPRNLMLGTSYAEGSRKYLNVVCLSAGASVSCFARRI